MTQKEAAELLAVCRNFLALDGEGRKFALAVTKDLLTVQIPELCVQSVSRGNAGETALANEKNSLSV